MTLAVADRRVTDIIVLPRGEVEESWMEVEATAHEARRDLGSIWSDVKRGRSPVPRLYRADGRMVRLQQFARMRAAEAAGIGYVVPGQLPMLDGCLDGDGGAA